MKTILIIISVVWVGYFVLARMQNSKRRKELARRKEKPSFRTEGDVGKYGKPMAGEHQSRVDFEDAD
ncbi:MAG: hypothetical protein Q7S07_05890 [Candidatus Omnitrophota bacterium]|nr:hypothetical protein [Candidatus Omnitrophota bacterium]